VYFEMRAAFPARSPTVGLICASATRNFIPEAYF